MDPLRRGQSESINAQRKPAAKADKGRKRWQTLRIKLIEVKNALIKKFGVAPLFNSKNISAHKASAVPPVKGSLVGSYPEGLDRLATETASVLREHINDMLPVEKCNDIASAYLVMHGLAKYRVPAGKGERTDFSLEPLKGRLPRARIEAMKQMVCSMSWPDMLSFYKNDSLVIPRKMGVLRGVRRIVSGLVAHGRPKVGGQEALLLEQVVNVQNRMKDPNSVYVVVFQDQVSGSAGHAALVVGGQGEGKEPLYVSHVSSGNAISDIFRKMVPGFTSDATKHIFEDDCAQFGLPDFIVELKGLDNAQIAEQARKTSGKGYNLTTQNCSTRTGELLLAGIPLEDRKRVRQPDGFWTPYDVTGLARDIWMAGVIKPAK